MVDIVFYFSGSDSPFLFFFGSMADAVLPFFFALDCFYPLYVAYLKKKMLRCRYAEWIVCCRYICYCSLPGTAYLQRGGRNTTEGAKNRARSLTEARIMLKKFEKKLFFMIIFGNVLNFLYFCANFNLITKY